MAPKKEVPPFYSDDPGEVARHLAQQKDGTVVLWRTSGPVGGRELHRSDRDSRFTGLVVGMEAVVRNGTYSYKDREIFIAMAAELGIPNPEKYVDDNIRLISSSPSQ